MKEIKIKIAGGYGNKNDIAWLFYKGEKFKMTEQIEEADLLVLTGGADIDPEIYKAKRNIKTYINEHRDSYEIADSKAAIDLGIPIIGICRGAQMLCALAGGKLIQHVTNHSRGHNMRIIENNSPFLNMEFAVNSLHHQMMYPFDLPSSDYTIIGTSSFRISEVYEGESIENTLIPEKECEVVYFHNILAYAIQFHPEMMNSSLDVIDFLRQDIRFKFKNLFEQESKEKSVSIQKEEHSKLGDPYYFTKDIKITADRTIFSYDHLTTGGTGSNSAKEPKNTSYFSNPARIEKQTEA